MANRSSSAPAALMCMLVIGVAIASTSFGQIAPRPNDQLASVEGEVRNAVDGLPIERAHVSVSDLSNGNGDRYGALTDAGGKFAIHNIRPGFYQVVADRVGFIDMDDSTTTATLKAGDTKDALVLKLAPTGSIIGRVFDADGKPVESIRVIAESGNRLDRSTVTDDRGMYRLGGLRPGRYRVRAAPLEMGGPPEIRTDNTAEVHYSATYHPNALDQKSATRVSVGAATDLTGIDIHLVRTPILHISGKVAGMPPNAQNVSLTLRSSSGGGNGAQVRRDGSFEIWRPAPGKYILQANYFDVFTQLHSAPVEIEVGDSDVENIAFQLRPSEDIHGQVEFLDEDARHARSGGQTAQPSAPRRISLRGTDGSEPAGLAEIGDDGSFTLPKVPTGKYRVGIVGPRVYVQSVQLGSAAMEDAMLDLRNGAGGAPVTVRVASATGVVQGTVTDDKGPVAGARIILFEDTAADHSFAAPSFASMVTAKGDGTYTIAGVAPGKYRIVVLDNNGMGFQGTADYDDRGQAIEVADHQTLNQDLKRD